VHETKAALLPLFWLPPPNKRKYSEENDGVAKFWLLTPLISLLVFFPFHPAWAVRPFITDDARVIPNHTLLTEASLRLDQNRFQNLTLFALGLTDRLEGTLGFLDGILLNEEQGATGQFSAAGPLLQLKYLFNEQKGKDGIPALAIEAGASAPWGFGSQGFYPEAWSQFLVFLMSKSFSDHPERLNLHVNIGLTNTNHPGKSSEQAVVWGIGTQVHLFRNVLYGVTEIASGDPYGLSSGAIYQIGLRFFASDRMQMDTSYGSGIWGSPRPGWFLGFGFRFFTHPLW
jgi:hypothetical protein